MRIWAVVFNATYSLVVSDGPIYLESVSITRSLDRLTRLNAPVAGNDIRALQHITARNILEIYCQPTPPAELAPVAARLLGAFIIDKLDVSITGAAIKRSIQGTGVMLALKDKLTLPGLTYDDATIEDIFNAANGLATLAAWTADVEAGIAGNQTSVRFDGTNVFKSMQAVTEIQGLHLRHTLGTVVEVGAFGTANGYRLEYIEGDTGPNNDYDTMPLLIESMEIIEEAAGDFYNFVLGFGAGQGDARLTLEKSTRPGIITVNDGSRDHYVVKDDASIAVYGQIERMVQIKKLAPVGTSEPQQVNAANALFDGLYENLQRHKEPQTRYRATVRNVQTTIQPGDKLRVIYQGAVWKDGLSAPYKWADINDDFWIMSVSETVGANGVQLQLEISNVDTYNTNAAEIIVGMVDSIEVNNIGVQPYPQQRTWNHKAPIDEATPIDFSFRIFDDVLRLVAVKAFIYRSVWTAVASSALDGGSEVNLDIPDHRHLVIGGINSVSAPTLWMGGTMEATEGGADAKAVIVGRVNETVPTELWTFSAGGGGSFQLPDHSHATEFSEVQQDSVLPEDCSLVVNGELVSSALFPESTGNDYEEIDITEEVLNKVGGWRGWHDINIDCGTNRGDLTVTLYIDVEVGTVRI
jgi:hypothetical protein